MTPFGTTASVRSEGPRVPACSAVRRDNMAWRQVLSPATASEEMSTEVNGTPEALLTAKEVAGLLKASEGLVYKLQRTGRLPAVRIGWLLRFHPDAVRAFMRGETPPTRRAR